MSTTMPALMTWPLWKANWREVLATAALAAGLEAGGLALFLYMFIQNPTRILPVACASLLVFLCFHVGVSALHAKLISHSDVSDAAAPTA